MIKHIYAIRDIAQNQWMNPMAMVNDADAERQFREIVSSSDPANLINKYPEHFELAHLATFDTDTGILIGNAQPRSMGTAATFKR